MSDPVQTIDEFLNVVRTSGLVEPGPLDETVAPWRAGAGPVPEACIQALVDKGLLTPWQLDQLRKGKTKGFFLGKYKLLRLLGTGGMSSVYLAEHKTLHNTVAIKVLPFKRVEQSSYLARFEKEARLSARLNHPNIARAFDLDTSGSIHFIVMEHIDGIDLHARVKEGGPLSVRDAADFIRQAALGLHYAHEEGLVHRDVKPANLILDKRGTVKILDLGLARASDDDDEASLTREHDEKVLGTADYLPPEQARDSHKADHRSDIYSLGCTLYYLLVGKAPFAKGTLSQRIRAHMNEPVPNLQEARRELQQANPLLDDVPPAIADLFVRMMEKHPDARQQSAKEVADALTAWLSATATAAGSGHRPLSSEPPRRSTARRPESAGDPGSLPRREGPLSPTAQLPTGRPPSSSGGPSSDSGNASGPGSSVIRTGTAPSRGASSPRPGSAVDLHSLSLTPPPSSGSRPTLRVPALPAQASDVVPPQGGSIVINTAARSGSAATGSSPRAVRPAVPPGGARSSTAAARRWLLQPYARIPLVGWLAGAAVLITAVAVAGWLFFGSSPEDVSDDAITEASDGAEPKKPEKKVTTPKKPPAAKSPTGSPKKPSGAPKKNPPPSTETTGPSPLDNLDSLRPTDPKSPAAPAPAEIPAAADK